MGAGLAPKRCNIRNTRKSTTKRKNSKREMAAAATAIPVKPKTAATNATTKKIIAQSNTT